MPFRIHCTSTATVAFKFAGFKIQLTKVYGEYCKIDKVYKTFMTDLDDHKHRLQTEWAKLDHAVIAAAVHQ